MPPPSLEIASTATDKNNNRAKTSRRKRIQQVESDEDEPRLVLRQGSADQTTDEMLIMYNLTWTCKVNGKKVAEDSVRNIKDSLEVFWKKTLYDQRERRLQQKGAPRNRKFLDCRVTIKSPGKGASLPFGLVGDSPTSGEHWKVADDYLVELGNKYAGKELLVKVEWEYEGDNSVVLAEDPNSNKTGSSATANMTRRYANVLDSADTGEACRIYSQICAVWGCDNPQSCSATGSDRKMRIPCWLDSKRRHYKLRSGIIQAWVEAIMRKEADVDIHRPPKSIVELLTSTAKEEKPQRPVTTSEHSGTVTNIYYGNRPDTASSKASRSSLRASSPFSLHDDSVEQDAQLFEYGLWLEHRCVSRHWRQEIRKAIELCDRECLCLEFARKRPISWWLGKDVKEGVALMLCNSVKRWRDWRSAEADKIRKVQRINAIGTDEYKVITISSEPSVDDPFPGLPAIDPYMYDTELLPLNDDIDRLQQHEEAQSEIEEGISQVLAQRLESSDEEDISQILAQRLQEANDDE